MSPSTSPTARVHREVAGPVVVLTVVGPLDVHAGRALVAAAAAAVNEGAGRLEIDLSDIVGYDDAGAGALLACRDIGLPLSDGVHYRTCGGGAGQEVLLRAYADGE